MENKIYLEQESASDLLNWSSEDYIKNGLDPNKGLLIMGTIGVGKTYLLDKYRNKLESDKDFKCFNNTSFQIELMGKEGTEHISHFINPYPMFIDDLGREKETVWDYKNQVNPLAYILFERYAMYQNYKSKMTEAEDKEWYLLNGFRYLTHATTNLDMESIGKKYGDYIADRLKDMCNIIVIKGESRR